MTAISIPQWLDQMRFVRGRRTFRVAFFLPGAPKRRVMVSVVASGKRERWTLDELKAALLKNGADASLIAGLTIEG